MSNQLIDLEPIDAEHDIDVKALVLTNYGGDHVIHVFVGGERVFVAEAHQGAEHSAWLCVAPYPIHTGERQAVVTTAQMVGAINEDQATAFAMVCGTPLEQLVFDDVMSDDEAQGNMRAWIDGVCEQVAKQAF